MMRLSQAQHQAVRKLENAGRPLSADELGTSIATLQALKAKGLVANVERFGGDNIGKERTNIRWKIKQKAGVI
ncbi:hypothetical protein ACUIHB_00345 [Aeromonas veronii]|uniref:hypothetical protein n=1 Tax=Aeromonas veronii TaxID=654 RepID=UPI00403DEC4B